jgi:precorrin-6Y C5,15-methyltransferase (decarboxylating)
MGKISVIGVGPGPREFLTRAAVRAIEEAEVLVGGEEVLKRFNGREKKVVTRDIREIMDYLREKKNKRIGVLTSGDPCFYSILAAILREFPREEVEIIPGISSLQLCLARIKETMNDAVLVSLHGRGLEELSKAVESRKLVILTDEANPANLVAGHLLKRYPRDTRVFVCENLARREERITGGTLAGIAKGEFAGNAVMVVKGRERSREYAAPGIPDELFLRGDAPMTKEEVRAVALAKARLREDSIVYDVGAGTGAVSVEAGLLAKKGAVYALEKNRERAELIRKNASRFGLENVRVVMGEAPEVLKELPMADRIIIGGSGGRLGEILQRCDEKLTRDGRMVINLVSLDSLGAALACLEKLGYEYEITQLIVNRGERLGSRLVLKPRTAVFIISSRRKRNETGENDFRN